MGPAASTVSPVRMLMPCPFVAAHRRAWRAPARVGDYRALYEVNDEVVTVVVAKVGHGATRFYGAATARTLACSWLIFRLTTARAGLTASVARLSFDLRRAVAGSCAWAETDGADRQRME